VKLTRINILVLALVLIFTTGCFLTPGGKTYVISGTIVDTDGAPIDGVILEITGDTELVIEDFNEHGGWEAEVKGTVTVTPSHREFNFEPREIEVRRANKNVNFIGQHIPPYNIGGRITDSEGNLIEGVILEITGDANLTIAEFQENGDWEAEVKGNITVTPVHPEYNFEPTEYDVNQANPALDFVGTYLEPYTISGQILNEFGYPIQAARVVITGQYEDEFDVEDENGAWSTQVRGLVYVTAIAEGYEFGTILVDEEDDAVNLIGAVGSLLIHYTFDEFETNVVVDETSNGINGEVNGNLNLVDGVIGQAFFFDGETFIDMPEISLKEYPNLTLSFWVNPEQLGSWVMMFRMWGQLDDFFFMFLDDQVTLFWAPAGYGPEFPIPVDEWSHLALTCTDNMVIFYLNGEEVGAYGTPNKISDMGQLDSISIGGGDHNPHLIGAMDDFRIYKQALPPEGIEAIYSAGVK